MWDYHLLRVYYCTFLPIYSCYYYNVKCIFILEVTKTFIHSGLLRIRMDLRHNNVCGTNFDDPSTLCRGQ